MKSERIELRIDPPTRKRLERMAKAEQRTVSDYIRILILRAAGETFSEPLTRTDKSRTTRT